jgi:hypothetical protein
MEPADKVKRLINKSDIRTDSEVDKRILGDALEHLAKLKQKKLAGTRPNVFRAIFTRPIAQLAAAVILLIGLGYVAGRLSTPPPNVEQLRSDIYKSVLEQVNRDRQAALASNNAQFNKEFENFKEELNVQYTRDLNEFAAKTLAVSGAVTNQLLRELIYRVGTTQLQDRYRIAAALKQIESNRVQDKTELSKGLVGLAALTRIELNRTKQNMAEMLSITPPDSLEPNIPSFPKPQDERSKK